MTKHRHENNLIRQAIEAVADPVRRRNRSAALSVWKRIASNELSVDDTMDFIRTVAKHIVTADGSELNRGQALIRACGLNGRRDVNDADRIARQYQRITDQFEDLSEPGDKKRKRRGFGSETAIEITASVIGSAKAVANLPQAKLVAAALRAKDASRKARSK